MSQRAKHLILIELRRRFEKQKLIDALIRDHFKKKKKASLKRGIVHETIAKDLGLILNFKLRTLVNERMEALGFKRRVLHGNRLFNNVIFRNSLQPDQLGK